MKLATALSERADLQKKLDVLRTRLSNNAKVQEGEKPAEDPALLLDELERLTERLGYLIERINLTNCRTLRPGTTITALLARRDCLIKSIAIMRDFLDNASQKVDRYSKSEIRIVSTVDVAALQKDLDGKSAELRRLEEQIQELNWTTELEE